jgi:hypothetical protein
LNKRAVTVAPVTTPAASDADSVDTISVVTDAIADISTIPGAIRTAAAAAATFTSKGTTATTSATTT